MLKKVTVLVTTCFIGLCFTSVAAFAQEGGEEDPEEEVIINTDSSSTEILLEESKPEPTGDVLRGLPEDAPTTTPKPIIIDRVSPKVVTPPANNSEKAKTKDGKSDVSFNIFYYLFYKFKHVDG